MAVVARRGFSREAEQPKECPPPSENINSLMGLGEMDVLTGRNVEDSSQVSANGRVKRYPGPKPGLRWRALTLRGKGETSTCEGFDSGRPAKFVFSF